MVKTTKKPLNVSKISTWEEACKLKIFRSSPCGIYTGRIEPGVNFFVLMLEQIGAVPHYSCEGHPNGFYVLFHAPVALALKIKQCGYFTVEVEGKNTWSIRLNSDLTAESRAYVLSSAAEAWFKRFGFIDASGDRQLLPTPHGVCHF